MAGSFSSSASQERIAVVTGSNKGIGLEICRQLASKGGTKVVLTARDEKRGVEALEKLKGDGLSDVVFHQLDVTQLSSIASLVDFLGTQFGKLDILVNNAGVSGLVVDYMALGIPEGSTVVFIPNEALRAELGDPSSLTEERMDEVEQKFLKDLQDQKLEENGWPTRTCAYKVSKVLVSSYTRMLARRYPDIIVNCVHPGFVKTDLVMNAGTLSVEEGARGAVMLALLPDGSPSGLFYDFTEVASFD